MEIIKIAKRHARAYVRNHFAFGIGGAPSLSSEEMERVTGLPIERRPLSGGCAQLMIQPVHREAERSMQTRARRIEERYNRFARYMREDRHGWTRTGRGTAWADNSVDVEEISALTGERRNVQVTPPHGDVCF